jgi:hypothetical protein
MIALNMDRPAAGISADGDDTSSIPSSAMHEPNQSAVLTAQATSVSLCLCLVILVRAGTDLNHLHSREYRNRDEDRKAEFIPPLI